MCIVVYESTAGKLMTPPPSSNEPQTVDEHTHAVHW
jgi:hypothetical protein